MQTCFLVRSEVGGDQHRVRAYEAQLDLVLTPLMDISNRVDLTSVTAPWTWPMNLVDADMAERTVKCADPGADAATSGTRWSELRKAGRTRLGGARGRPNVSLDVGVRTSNRP